MPSILRMCFLFHTSTEHSGMTLMITPIQCHRVIVSFVLSITAFSNSEEHVSGYPQYTYWVPEYKQNSFRIPNPESSDWHNRLGCHLGYPCAGAMLISYCSNFSSCPAKVGTGCHLGSCIPYWSVFFPCHEYLRFLCSQTSTIKDLGRLLETA